MYKGLRFEYMSDYHSSTLFRENLALECFYHAKSTIYENHPSKIVGSNELPD